MGYRLWTRWDSESGTELSVNTGNSTCAGIIEECCTDCERHTFMIATDHFSSINMWVWEASRMPLSILSIPPSRVVSSPFRYETVCARLSTMALKNCLRTISAQQNVYEIAQINGTHVFALGEWDEVGPMTHCFHHPGEGTVPVTLEKAAPKRRLACIRG